MKKKFLRVTMPNGQKWDVPAHLIADNRAKYYAEKEGQDKYKEEYDFTMSDEYELKDWASNNMNWDDVKDKAELAPSEEQEVDYQEGWTNGDKEIVKK